jgi:hypothetical protein
MQLTTKINDWTAGQTILTTRPTVLEQHIENDLAPMAHAMLIQHIRESNPHVVVAEITVDISIRLSSVVHTEATDAAQGAQP